MRAIRSYGAFGGVRLGDGARKQGRRPTDGAEQGLAGGGCGHVCGSALFASVGQHVSINAGPVRTRPFRCGCVRHNWRACADISDFPERGAWLWKKSAAQ